MDPCRGGREATGGEERHPQDEEVRRLRAAAANLGLLAVTVALFAAVVEIGLRLTGFSYVLYPEEIEFGRPDPVLLATGFEEDEDLFWVTPGYEEKLERLRENRPAVLFQGDSCTHLGHYDEELARIVLERRGVELRYGNLGVAGWSSYQGRRQLGRDAAPLAPRVVTFYYGWNDHWIGFGIEDKNVARIKAIFSRRWSRLRLVQLATQGIVAIGARQTAYPDRVSLSDYRDNLRWMVRHARSQGIRPVLITAASAHVPGEEPEELGGRFLRDLTELVPLHASYVAATREVAEGEGADLCAPAAVFAALPRGALERLFQADGIHLTSEGDRRLAEVLYDCFESRGIWEEILD